MVIGIAGKYCSGKNTLAEIFESRGWTIIDADKIGHETLNEKQTEILKAFGKSILGPDLKIDRKKLGRIVFNNKDSLDKLERILHPSMKEKIIEKISQPKGRYVINAALLFRLGLHEKCSMVIWVNACFFTRLTRALSRDKIGLIGFLKRAWAQRKLSAKSWLNNVDIYNVDNNSGREELLKSLPEAVKQII